jgi:hypothetical protein
VAEAKTQQKPGAAGQKQAQARAKLEGRNDKKQEQDVELLVNELEQRLDRLRASYDQYFMGIEKVPPHVQIKDVERRFAELRKINIRNTALRFKFQTLVQKQNTYQSYWNRISRQIEEGTYKRDVRRAKERFGPGAKRGRPVHDLEIDVDLDEMMADDPELEALLNDEDDAVDTVRRTPSPAPLPRHADPARLLELDDRGGMPVVLPRGPIEERPSQKHVMHDDERTLFQAPKPQASPPQAQRPQAKGLMPPGAVPPPGARGYLRPIGSGAPSPGRAPQPGVPGAPPAASGRPQQPPPQHAAAPAQVPPARKSNRAPAPRAPAPAPAAPRSDGDLSDARMRQLYSQYIETKRQQRESTATLTYDSLAKSLRESSEKIQAKHAGKKVDFEVTVKDGKTILRPVVKDK